MEFVIVGILLAAIVLALLIGSLGRRGMQKTAADEKGERPREPCPICGSRLEKGQRIRSVVFRDDPNSTREHMVHIFGCPYCCPPTGTARRQCPVCRQTIPPEGYLVGRMWEKRGPARGVPEDGSTAVSAQRRRTHLHVLGCTECRTRGART